MNTRSRYAYRSCVLAMVIVLLSVATTLAEQTEIINTAYFDDGNDKQAIVDLRERRSNGEALTSEENFILQAASRTGQVYFCKGASSNATLIRIDGQDAIITTAHSLIDTKTALPKCADFSKSIYYPNISFYDKRRGPPDGFEKRSVALRNESPLNFETEQTRRYKTSSEFDFLVAFLDQKEEPVSQDIMPDGTIRGFMKLRLHTPETGKLFMIGFDPKFRDGLAIAYQICDYNISLNKSKIFHACDTVSGTSSSVLATLQGDELFVSGIHQQGTDDTESLNTDYLYWNKGVSISNVLSYIESKRMGIN